MPFSYVILNFPFFLKIKNNNNNALLTFSLRSRIIFSLYIREERKGTKRKKNKKEYEYNLIQSLQKLVHKFSIIICWHNKIYIYIVFSSSNISNILKTYMKSIHTLIIIGWKEWTKLISFIFIFFLVVVKYNIIIIIIFLIRHQEKTTIKFTELFKDFSFLLLLHHIPIIITSRGTYAYVWICCCCCYCSILK